MGQCIERTVSECALCVSHLPFKFVTLVTMGFRLLRDLHNGSRRVICDGCVGMVRCTLFRFCLNMENSLDCFFGYSGRAGR